MTSDARGGQQAFVAALILALTLVLAALLEWWAATKLAAATVNLIAVFLAGVALGAVASGVAFYAFVRRAGADWRRL